MFPMDNLPDLNALQVFSAVVDAQGFRGAARVLGLPKSTVSRKLADLEARLGLRLLQRTTRKVALTDAGEALYRQCAPALAALAEAQKSLVETQAAPQGQLRITAPQSFAELFLGPVLEQYYRQYPEVRVTIDLTDRYVDLITEGYDLALRAGELPDSSLVARTIGGPEAQASGRMRWYASPAYLAARGTPKTPRDFTRHDCIYYGSTERGAKWTFLVRKRRLVLPVKPRITCNSFFMLLDAAVAGHGIARIPSFFAAEAEAKGKLVAVLDDCAVPPTAMHAVYPTAHNVSARVRVFLELLVNHFAVGPWKVQPAGQLQAAHRRTA
jgi:DNA-binding transcriptional LysR family regulator